MSNLKYDVLERFGLNEKEADVYLACLNENNLTPTKISAITHIPRTSIYDILLNLSLKGLVELEQSDGFSKQQTLVRCKNPSTLREIIHKKKEDLTELEVDLVEVLPSLSKSFNKNLTSPYFKFYPGIEGMRKVYLDTELRNIDLPEYTWNQLFSMNMIEKEKMNSEVALANKKRKSLKNKPKELVPLNDWTKHVISYQYSRDPNYLRNTDLRYIEIPEFKMFSMLSIKSEYVSISCSNGDEAWGLKIKSQSFASSLISIFKLNWMMATPVTEELIQSWGENEFLSKEKEQARKNKLKSKSK